MDMSRLYLGLDSSTQGLKATLVDEALAVVFEAAVAFDRDLPEFGTRGGVHRGGDGLTVTAPALMWVAALDLLLARLRDEGAPLGQVACISGSGQQHGSVWLNAGARAALRGLRPESPLRPQLEHIFSVADSPVWMDSSTGAECRALESALGGAQAVAELTGSRAYERFTGNQIAKIHRLQPEAYAATDRLALVSSFMATLLIGDYAPIDTSDGSGMNLMDLRARDWSPEALQATAPGLEARLGPLAASHQVIGLLHGHFVTRYGFPETCRVVAFSGDNPNSLAGLRLERAGDLAISLGTSDTLFGSLREPVPSAEEGHVFANPVDPQGYMAMICRKNGSLTREYVRDTQAGGAWDTFNRLLAQTPPGNAGCLGVYVLEAEITPAILRTGVFLRDAADRPLDALTPAQATRAVLESQFLSMRLHGARMGLSPRRVIATGGASVNTGVLRVVADVFGTPVFAAEQADSASLGAAYRAMHGLRVAEGTRWVEFREVFMRAKPFRKVMDPDPAAHQVYSQLLPRLDRFEADLLAGR